LSEEELALLGKGSSSSFKQKGGGGGGGGGGAALLGAAVEWGQTALASLSEPEPGGTSSPISLESGGSGSRAQGRKQKKKEKKRNGKRSTVGRYETRDEPKQGAAASRPPAAPSERSMLPANSAAARLRVVSTCVAENKTALASGAALFLLWWILG